MEAAHQHWPALGALLVREGVISEDDLEAALLQQRIVGAKLGKILVDRGLVTAEELEDALAHQLDDPHLEHVDEGSSVPLELAPESDATPAGHDLFDDLADEDEPQMPLLGTLLLRDALVTEDELESALDEQRSTGTRLGEILVARGSVTSEHVCRRLAEQHDLDFAEVTPAEVDAEAARLLPEDVARERSILPLRFLAEGPLLVGLADPTNVFQADRLRLELGIPLRFVVATPEAIAAAIDHVHGVAGAEPEQAVEPPTTDAAAEVEPAEATEPTPHWPPLGTLLVRDGHVTDEELDAALAQQRMSNKRLGEILVERGLASPAQIARALAEQHELPFLELGGELDGELARRLPADLARRFAALPVERLADESLLVAVGDPTNALQAEEIRLALDVPVRFGVADPADIEQALARVHEQALAVVEVEDDAVLEVSAAEELRLDDALRRAVSLGATDIHLSPQPDGVVVRARVDGVVHEVTTIPVGQQDAVTSRLEELAGLHPAERAPRHGRIELHEDGRTHALRLTTLPTTNGEKVTLHAVDHGAVPSTLAELGMSAESEALLRKALEQPYGAVLTCGPAGSGRTTTLYAALRELNARERTLTTIEDPVEHRIAGVDQVEVDPSAGLTFAHGLRAILGSDPDVILVGEIHDGEAARIALGAAQSGHLVLSSLHALSAASAVRQLVDLGIEPAQLAATLMCVVSQRLARRVCADCRETYYPDSDELAGLGRPAEETGRRLLARGRGRGCPACMGTGHRGWVALFEVLSLDEEVRAVVASGAPVSDIQRAAVAAGIPTLRDDGIRLCLDGITTPSELRRVTGHGPS